VTPWTDPTHSGAARPRKPRRLWLYLPWALAAALAIGWSLAWVWLMGETERRMDAGAAQLRVAGWRVAWASRHVGGYPFRLDVDLTGLVVADPSGWGIAAPALKSEAYAFAPTHWVFFVPSGLVLSRPQGGAINVAARVLRGSVVVGEDQDLPRIALEGDNMSLLPFPDAEPMPLMTIRNLQFYTRPGPDDQGAAYLEIDGGQAEPTGWLGALAGGGEVNFRADMVFSHVSGFRGRGWRDALTAWTHAGGAADLGHLGLTAGSQSFASQSGAFAVADDGRLVGQLALTGPQPLALRFKNGGAWLGATQVAPAPALF
jgi:hypothetical protein